MTDQPSSFNSADPEYWESFARYLAGESSAEEAEAVRRWLAADPARQELLNSLSSTIGRVKFAPPAALDVEAALVQAKKRSTEPEIRVLPGTERFSRDWSKSLLRIAAALLLFIGAALIYRVFQRGDVNGQTYTTTVGQADSVNLPDGTRVILAPLSQLVVPGDYGKRERVVQLRGEAFFDAGHDRARPFSVRAGEATVQDLGTTFSVRAEAIEGVRVVVTSGSVLLRSNRAADAGLLLKAGQSGVLRPHAQQAQADRVSAADLAWTRGRLVFENAPLERVITDLRRWYGVELRVIDASLNDRHITASFDHENAQQVLDIIALTLGAQVERRGDTAFIRRAAPR